METSKCLEAPEALFTTRGTTTKVPAPAMWEGFKTSLFRIVPRGADYTSQAGGEASSPVRLNGLSGACSLRHGVRRSVATLLTHSRSLVAHSVVVSHRPSAAWHE